MRTLTFLLSLILFFGCAEKSPQQISSEQVIKKHKNLPEWVLNDDDVGVAVGSSMYVGQSYNQQYTEAVSIAKMNLSQKLVSKVDSMYKTYYSNKKSNNSQLSAQVSSSIMKNVKVNKTFVAEDGELFVEISAEVDDLLDNEKTLFNEMDKRIKEQW